MKLRSLWNSEIRWQELQKVTEAAELVGLLSPKSSEARPFMVISGRQEPRPGSTSQVDPDIALAVLHIEIELRLRVLAYRSGIDERPKNTKGLLRSLFRCGTFTDQEYSVLKQFIALLDRARIGCSVEMEVATWAAEVGPRLLAVLEKHPIPPDLSIFGL